MSENNEAIVPIVMVPVLNRGDLLLRCVLSMDAAVRRLIIINNGRDRSVLDAIAELQGKRHPLLEEVTVISPRRNLGVAASWNIGLELMAFYDLPYIVIIGSDVKLAPGDLRKMSDSYEDGTMLNYTNQHYNFFMISRLALHTFGYFDENFYPAYMEDCDYSYRMALLGHSPRVIDGIHILHGDDDAAGSCTIHSDPVLFALNQKTHVNNARYYFRKWGGEHTCEKYSTPFDRKEVGVDWWCVDEKHFMENNIWPND